ncbi:hypothetical protein [Lysobacter sp. CA199]|uniref:hypothetical protein n=1 Tax=Lysobacter sp. CA199 TaxID=3455608 RepID=UPI003F8D2991
MIGVLICLVALMVAAFAMLALLDPAGAQLANDADPFGTPPSTAALLGRLAVSLAVMAGGIWLLLRPRGGRARRDRRSTPEPISGQRGTSKESQ